MRYFILWCILIVHAYANQMTHCSLKFDHNITISKIPVAQTDEEKIKGLSGIDHVGVGMLFAYSEPQRLTFWMHNTHVPLSIGFIDANGILFQLEDMQKNTETMHRSTRDAVYALELPRGDFQRLKLSIGSKLLNCTCVPMVVMPTVVMPISKQVLQEVNRYRAQYGLSALELSDELTQIARRHSQDMMMHKIPFGHAGFQQRVMQMRAKFTKFAGAAENVAYRYATAKIVVDGWMHSSGHRRNILGNYNLTGIGVVYDKQGHPWYTQVFLRRF